VSDARKLPPPIPVKCEWCGRVGYHAADCKREEWGTCDADPLHEPHLRTDFCRNWRPA
jgi:hypothetical protein